MNEKGDIAVLVKQTIARILEISEDQITPDAELVRDLGANSLDLMELELQLETVFESTPLLVREMESARRVSDVIELFWTRVQEGKAKVRELKRLPES